MKEINDILAAWKKCRMDDQPAALATVVRVEGSGYRRPGARMLILPGSATIGTISGGCLERDVIYRAGAVAASGTPAVVRYDSISEEEAGPGASLGCGGTIDILIESLAPPHGEHALELLDWLWSRRARGLIITVIAQHNTDMPVGSREAIDLQTQRRFSFSVALTLMSQSFGDAASHVIRKATPGGWVDLFVELIEPPLELFIFGAGADAIPVASLARSLGWRVSVVDLRSGPAAAERIFDADAVVRTTTAKLAELHIPPDAAAIVMNHNWNSDLATLERLHELPLKYLGVLGPRRRTDRMLSRIKATAPAARHVCYPIGLDIGAQTPQEIAVAIISEITCVLHSASGGSLSERAGPIHSRPDENKTQADACPLAAS